MGKNEVFTISGSKDQNRELAEKPTVDLEEAIDIAGIGWYNIRLCFLFAGFLISVIMESAGYAYVLPAAKCDLDITDQQRGLLCAIPYFGIVVTSFVWGYQADTRGRKPTVIFTSLCTGFLGALALLMPNLISFAVVKLLASLFMASPAGISYALIGETTPARYRDLALSIVNASQILGSSAIPLLGWLIIRLDFHMDFGVYVFRPWRLLGMVYSLALVLCGLLMLAAPESPKFLVAKGRLDEALVVLQNMYAVNKGKRPEDFPVGGLRAAEEQREEKPPLLQSLRMQSVPLFKPPYLKWMVLNSFLLFGVMSTLNGLFMWVPDVLNRVLGGGAAPGSTVCQVIEARLNASAVAGHVCDDYITTSTFQINSIANACIALFSLLVGISVKFFGKKTALVSIYLLVGSACLATNYVTLPALFAMLLSSLQLTAICIGSINAYSVAIFPTELRGMAVGLSIMFGRMGSVLGVNVAAILINANCEATFFGFGGLLLICGTFSFLLPRAGTIKK